jgi:hypothetical protein
VNRLNRLAERLEARHGRDFAEEIIEDEDLAS